MTKEEAMARFMASKKRKEDSLQALKERVAQVYEEQTGLAAKYVLTL